VFALPDYGHTGANGSLDTTQPVRVVRTGEHAAVVLVSVSTVDGLNHLLLRSITDTGGGRASAIMVAVEFAAGGYHRVGNMVFDGADLKVVSAASSGNGNVKEHTINTSLGGFELVADVPPVALGEACDTLNGSTLEAFAASYQGGLSYVFSCGSAAAESFSHYLAEGDTFTPTPIPSSVGASSHIVRQYVKAEGQHIVVLGGEDPGPRLGLRVGRDAAGLGDAAYLQLSTDPLVFTALKLASTPDGSQLFMVGAALAGAQPGVTAPMVPADGYAGTLTSLSNINRVPPEGLQVYGRYEALRDLYNLGGVAFVGNHVVKAGVKASPPDTIALSVFEPDGSVLVDNAPVYSAPGAVIDDKISGAVAPLGIGSVVTWVENREVRARVMTCSSTP
jgi:hypothetical protein